MCRSRYKVLCEGSFIYHVWKKSPLSVHRKAGTYVLTSRERKGDAGEGVILYRC